MKPRTAAVTVALAVILTGVGAMAQTSTPTGRVVPPFDPKTVETFSGAVVTEQNTGNFVDIHVLMVKAGGDLRTVLLGPKRLLDPALTQVAPKTTVDVTASKVLSNGTPIYLASAVKMGDKTYKLRDGEGHLLDRNGRPLRRR